MMKTFHFMLVGAVIATSMLLTAPVLQMSYAHQRALFNINGQDYLFVIGSLNEPVSVDDKTGVELRAIYPDPSNPTDSRANGTKPVTGLEESLNVEILAGDKNLTSNL